MHSDLRRTEIVSGVNFELLLEAIKATETAGGVNNHPNLEPGYLPPGITVTIEGRLVHGTGSRWNRVTEERWYELPIEARLATACSWGPWQILYHTAYERGFRGLPWDLAGSAVSEPFVRRQLERLRDRFQASTVRDFADGWNSGNPRDTVRVEDYTAKVIRAYVAFGGKA